MKTLKSYKEEIHKCSKCGLCQGSCPIYEITGNDCTVSRGLFAMLYGVIKGDLKMSNTINRYLELCLKCGKCSKACPSGIDIVDIIVAAKSEVFKKSLFEKFKSLFIKYILLNGILDIIKLFFRPTKSKKFEKQILYFGGCGSKIKGDKGLVKIFNSIGIELINPEFSCCGVPYFTKGDLKEYNNSIKNYIKILKKYNLNEVITTCASCEKTLKNYIKWTDNEEESEFLKQIQVKNVYEFLHSNNIKLKLKKNIQATYHKPCNIDNYDDIEWMLNNSENLDYIKMENYDSCCGLSGITNLSEYKTFLKIFNKKRKCIKSSKTKVVLTSCLGCESALRAYSFGNYKTFDLIDYIGKNI